MMVCSFPTTRLVGGDSVAANNLARGYLDGGHKVTLVSISPFGFNGPLKTILGLDSIGFRPDYGKRAGRVLREFLDLYDPKALAFFKQRLQEEQPDCVHFQGLHDGVSAYAPVVTKKLGIPSIVTEHGVVPICARYRLEKALDNRPCSGPSTIKCLLCKRHGFPYKIPVLFRNQFYKKFACASNYIVVNSHSCRSWLIANGYPPGKVSVVYYGLDASKFHPGNLSNQHRGPASPFRVLFVGRVRAKKGIRYLIDACAALVNQGYPIELDIVGDLDPGLTGCVFVRFLGPVQRADLPVYYRQADVLVQPSITYEPFGLTLIEAMACGTPVVATDLGGMPEVVADAGIIVPARDSQALARAIEQLILHPDFARELGQKGRHRFECLFTLETYTAGYLAILSKIVAECQGQKGLLSIQ